MSRPDASSSPASRCSSDALGLGPLHMIPEPYLTKRRVKRSCIVQPPNHMVIAFGPVRLRFQIHVVEVEELAVIRHRRVGPGRTHHLELLIEDVAPAMKRHPERVVLGLVPAHRWQDHEAAIRQLIECSEFLGEQERMPQRDEYRRADQPQRGSESGDGRPSARSSSATDRSGAWLPGIAYSRTLVGTPLASEPRPKDDVLAEHHTVEPMFARPARRRRPGPERRSDPRSSSSRSCSG